MLPLGFCNLRPVVFQSHGLVEHNMIGRGVEVGHEVTDALELQILAWLALCCERLYIAFGEHIE